MFVPPQNIIHNIRATYPVGTRVELTAIKNMPVNPGCLGTVTEVDDAGSVHVDWDNGSNLTILYGEDECRRIGEDVAEKTVKINSIISNRRAESDKPLISHKELEIVLLEQSEAEEFLKNGKTVFMVYSNAANYPEGICKICYSVFRLRDHYELYNEMCGVTVETYRRYFEKIKKDAVEEKAFENIRLFGKYQPTANCPICPRCGRETMEEKLAHNVQSRNAPVYVCNECATQEAMLEGLNMKPLEFSKWAINVQEDTVL